LNILACADDIALIKKKWNRNKKTFCRNGNALPESSDYR